MKRKSGLLMLLILGAVVLNPGGAYPQIEKEGDMGATVRQIEKREYIIII